MKFLWSVIAVWLLITLFSRRTWHKLLALSLGFLALLAALAVRADLALSDLWGRWLS